MNHRTRELFPPAADTRQELLTPGAWLLRGFALSAQNGLLEALQKVIHAAPIRHMETPGGFRMSVGMTNCGQLGWVSDRRGYRYTPSDPLSGDDWPPMPVPFAHLAVAAAAAAGFDGFQPDACLINRYEPGTRLTLHQDKDESDYHAPIVSVSLGLPAVFLFGGAARTDKPIKVPLRHGDVVVWGGLARLRYHGVATLKDGTHESLGSRRMNLTFRRAGRPLA